MQEHAGRQGEIDVLVDARLGQGQQLRQVQGGKLVSVEDLPGDRRETVDEGVQGRGAQRQHVDEDGQVGQDKPDGDVREAARGVPVEERDHGAAAASSIRSRTT